CAPRDMRAVWPRPPSETSGSRTRPTSWADSVRGGTPGCLWSAAAERRRAGSDGVGHGPLGDDDLAVVVLRGEQRAARLVDPHLHGEGLAREHRLGEAAVHARESGGVALAERVQQRPAGEA